MLRSPSPPLFKFKIQNVQESKEKLPQREGLLQRLMGITVCTEDKVSALVWPSSSSAPHSSSLTAPLPGGTGDRTRTADLNWPKGHAILCDIMQKKKMTWEMVESCLGCYYLEPAWALVSRWSAASLLCSWGGRSRTATLNWPERYSLPCDITNWGDVRGGGHLLLLNWVGTGQQVVL